MSVNIVWGFLMKLVGIIIGMRWFCSVVLIGLFGCRPGTFQGQSPGNTSPAALATAGIPSHNFKTLPVQIPSGLAAVNSNPNQNVMLMAVGNVVGIGTPNGLLLSVDGGNTWNTVTAAQGLGSSSVNSLFIVSNGIYVGTSDGLSISTNNGTSWVTVTTAQGLVSNNIQSVYVSGNTIFAGTDQGLSVSTNNGGTWQTMPAVQNAVTNSVLGFYAVGSIWYLSMNTFSTFNNNNVPSVMPQTVFISQNNGTSWSSFPNINGNVAVSVSGKGGNYLYAVTATVSNGTANNTNAVNISGNSYLVANNYVSSDLGNTWNIVNNVPTSSAFSDALNNTLYFTSTNGLAITTNNGSTWTTFTTAQGLADNNIISMSTTPTAVYVLTQTALSVASLP